MNELRKNTLKRLLNRCGLRISRSRHYRHTYDRANFPRIKGVHEPAVFDVGANIGQSSLWFAVSFPLAKVFAFEPLPRVYDRLVANTKSHGSISCRRCALGKLPATLSLPAVESDSIQTFQVLGSEPAGSGPTMEVEVTTVDRAAADAGVSSIAILKTDTEGYDIDVLTGATELLRAGRITYIVSEACIRGDDMQHTNLFNLIGFLAGFGYRLVSLFDLCHEKDGTLAYLNALFVGPACDAP